MSISLFKNENYSNQYLGKRELRETDFAKSFQDFGLNSDLSADQPYEIAEDSGSLNVDPRELQNLEYIAFMVRKIQEAGGIHNGPGVSVLSGEEVAEIAGVYLNHWPSDERINDIRRQAEALSEAFFNDPRMVHAAQNWGESDFNQRQSAMAYAFEIAQNVLELPEKVGMDTFYSERTPFNNEYIAFYDPRDWAANINLHDTANPTFAEALSSLFHELIHAVDDYRTRNIGFSQIANEYKEGNISYEDALIRVNSYIYLDLGYSWPGESGEGVFIADELVYTGNPIERNAFSGEIILRENLRSGGENVPLRLPTSHPLHQHLLEREVIDSSIAGFEFG